MKALTTNRARCVAVRMVAAFRSRRRWRARRPRGARKVGYEFEFETADGNSMVVIRAKADAFAVGETYAVRIGD